MNYMEKKVIFAKIRPLPNEKQMDLPGLLNLKKREGVWELTLATSDIDKTLEKKISWKQAWYPHLLNRGLFLYLPPDPVPVVNAKARASYLPFL